MTAYDLQSSTNMIRVQVWIFVYILPVSCNAMGTLFLLLVVPRAGSGAVSKWVICACDSLVDFGTV